MLYTSLASTLSLENEETGKAKNPKYFPRHALLLDFIGLYKKLFAAYHAEKNRSQLNKSVKK